MPLLRLQTTVTLDAATRDALARDLGEAAAAALGKPLAYMMVVMDPPCAALTLGGDPAPAALVEVRSAGEVTPERAAALMEAVSRVTAALLAVDPDRIYTIIDPVPRPLWGIGPRPLG